jgi:hypothetical protein
VRTSEENEKLAANILNSAFPTQPYSGDGIALVSARHPEVPTVPRYEDMTRTTGDIAEYIASRFTARLGPSDLSFLKYEIERQLDKYFDEGTLVWRTDREQELEDVVRKLRTDALHTADYLRDFIDK